ncbi:MAG: ImmA/IrrE family metallo-endopeptidase [Acidobacteria bacterium]|nr:ImmA/IrrE family metallo-endopeptidase [Acidobacteriota bacterium]
MTKPTAAEQLLIEYGITTPQQIDLEAIAYDLGALVRFTPLQNHEARIVGVGDRAIITVDSTKSFRRRRFSLGHELGHWQLHRGTLLYCASRDIGSERAADAEKMANRFAADLLMPRYLFHPELAKFTSPSWEVVAELSTLFNVSRPAAAIRLIDADRFPVVLVCHRPDGTRWFRRSPCVPDSWYVLEEIDTRTTTLDLLHGSADETRARTTPASAWFTRYDANRFQVREQAIRSETDVYTLVWFLDRRALG